VSEFVLQTRGIDKQFGGVPVLKKVDIDIKKGEVHALMGENGAGKSTLIKIITGVYTKDAGEIFVDGEPVSIASRADADAVGISVIYQELSLIQTLTVAQNIFLGQEHTKFQLTKKKEMRESVKALIDKYGFDIDPNAEVSSLGMAQRQTVEILKALRHDVKLIIMDEPTSALSAAESEKLFETIDELREKGASILYISHRLEEVYRIADRLTIMRDGENVAVLSKEEISAPTVTKLMIGHEVKNERMRKQASRHMDNVLEVRNLYCKDILKGVSFTAYGGEILGIGGLIGAGRTELIRCIYGALKPESGRGAEKVKILLNGKPISRNIGKNMRGGFGFVPEDRLQEGFIPLLPVMKNLALSSYDFLATFGVVQANQEKKCAVVVI
jgi:ribose transport system ATP-binding protein